MEEDEDDFYGGVKSEGAEQEHADDIEDAAIKDEKMNDSDAEEEDDDDDDVQFTLDKPADAKPETTTRPPAISLPSHDRKPSNDLKQPKSSGTPALKPDRKPSQPARTTSPLPTSGTPNPPTHASKPGSAFPAPRTCTLDLDAVPLWPRIDTAPGGPKLLTSLDLDADLVTHSKPWRQPGTDQTDFFNYGFDEYTWTQYCLKQQSMAAGIAEQRDADAKLKAMLEGGGGGGGAGGGGGGGMPGGMPSLEQMQQMMGMMGGPGGMGMGPMGMGMDPQAMMGMMQVMPGMQGPGPQQQQGGFQQGGFGGSGRASVEPAAPNGGGGGGMGGFQPPQGPGGGGGGGNIEGYSPQQLAIMQNEQGGGRGGRRGRGRW
ncbi:hypothetical protein LTR53_009501 [Teratosphaeriaceae sp. CCFEE 6253]|nr:hypothetical protein LTR53_009501 [Teratosphaeriaceae sp. CCFEE 6253]